jgi:lysophospholipase L1-like esterase
MALIFEPGQTVVFTGDSITDCGRRDAAAPLGSGYARMAVDLITCRYPEVQLSFVNTGISGNTVRDLSARCTTDVIALKPDWLSIMIGINDLWRWQSKQGPAAVSPDEYAELYAALLVRVKRETSARLILIDPFYIATPTGTGSPEDLLLTHLQSYQKTVAALAAEYGALHVQSHQMFAALLQHYAPSCFCPEPIHPNATGHMALAHLWLGAVGW